MNNIFELSKTEIETRLEALKSDGNFRNKKAIGHKKISELIDQLEKRLIKLQKKPKVLDWQAHL